MTGKNTRKRYTTAAAIAFGVALMAMPAYSSEDYIAVSIDRTAGGSGTVTIVPADSTGIDANSGSITGTTEKAVVITLDNHRGDYYAAQGSSAKVFTDNEDGDYGKDAITLTVTNGSRPEPGSKNQNSVFGTSGAVQVYGSISVNVLTGTYGSYTAGGDTFVGGIYATTAGVIHGNAILTLGVLNAGNETLKADGTIVGGGSGTINGNSGIIVNSGTIGPNGTYGTQLLGGGAWGGVVKGNSFVEINGGSLDVRLIAGAGFCGVGGNSSVTINAGTVALNASATSWVGSIYGGSIEDSSLSVGGNSSVTVTGGTVTIGNSYDGLFAGNASLYDGSAVTRYVTKNSEIAITGGEISSDIFAGNHAYYFGRTTSTAQIIANTSGDSFISVSGGTVSGDLFGGGKANAYNKSGSTVSNVSFVSNIAGKSEINLTGGDIHGNIYGAGWANGASAEASVGGQVTITLDGAAVSGDIYAGGRSSNSGTSVVGGGAVVNLKSGSVNNVYASGEGGATISGNVTVNLDGTAVVKGTLDGAKGTDTTKTTLNYTSGTFKSFKEFDEVNVVGSLSADADSFGVRAGGALSGDEKGAAAAMNVLEGASLTAKNLSVEAGGSFTAAGTLTVTSLDIAGGTYSQTGAATAANLTLNGGSADIKGDLVLSSASMTLKAGTMTIGEGGIVSAGTLLGGTSPQGLRRIDIAEGASLDLNGGKLCTFTDQVFAKPVASGDEFNESYESLNAGFILTKGTLQLNDEQFTIDYNNSIIKDFSEVTPFWTGTLVSRSGDVATSIDISQVPGGVFAQVTLVTAADENGVVNIEKSSTLGGKALEVTGADPEQPLTINFSTAGPTGPGALELLGSDEEGFSLIKADAKSVLINGNVNLGNDDAEKGGGTLGADVTGNVTVSGGQSGDISFNMNGNISGDVNVKSGGLHVSGDITANTAEVGSGDQGAVLTAKNMTVTGKDSSWGVLNVSKNSTFTVQDLKITSSKAALDPGADIELGALTITDGTVVLGTSDGGSFVQHIDKVLLNNGWFVIDPEWVIPDGANVVTTGLHASFNEFELTSGKFGVARASAATFGSDDPTWLQGIIDDAGEWGPNGISAAVGIYSPSGLTLGAESMLVVDGSLTGADDIINTYAEKGFALYLADGALLAVNTENLGASAAITAKGTENKANVQDEAIIYLAGAKPNATYSILSGFGGGIYYDETNLLDGEYTDEEILPDFMFSNKLLRVESLRVSDGVLKVTITGGVADDPRLARYKAMVDSFVLSGNMGGELPSAKLIDAIFSQTYRGGAAQALEASANFGSIAAGPALSDMRQVNDALAAHFYDEVNPLKRSSVWATPYYAKDEVSGMSSGNFQGGYDSKNYGVVVGWDKHLEKGRVGVALHVAKSDIDGAGVFSSASGDGKYFGGKIYGDWDFGRWQLTGDLGFGKSKTDLDSSITNPNYALNAHGVDATLFSAGARALFTAWKNDSLSIRPFVGARFTRYNQDGYDIRSAGKTVYHVDSADMNLWNFTLGARFDWKASRSESGWEIKPSAEVAYVRAAGDRSIKQNVRLNGGARSSALETDVVDDNAFAMGLGVRGKKNDFTMGLNLKGLFSSNQKNYGLNATFQWDF